MPADLQPTTARIRATTLNKYVRRQIELVYPRSPMLATLRAYKRISFNNSGKEIHWFPRFRRRELESGLGEQISVTFVATNTRLEARLPWRHYHMTERISRYERLVNKGPEALAKIVERVTDELLRDFEASFRRKLFVDGDATGSVDIHGLETIGSDRTKGSAVSGSPAFGANGSYAGVSMALGALGGSWNGNWPMGNGDAEYCAWTPMRIDTDSAVFGTGASWSTNWQEELRFAKTYLQMVYDLEPKVVVMDPELLRQAADSLKSTYRLEVTAKSPIVDIGIRTLSFEGLELIADSACPSGVAYMFNPDYLELMCLTGQLWERTEDSDITTQTDLVRLDFDGNLVVYSPASLARLAVYA